MTKRQNQTAPQKAACGYVRVSTDMQATEGVSLDAQMEKIKAYAALTGLELIEVVRDEGVSGSVPLEERPGGQRVWGMVRGRQVAHVIALKLDRLFRDAVDALATTREWDELDCALHLVDMGGSSLNSHSAMGRFFLGVLAGIAELERNLIAERTAMAIQHLKSQRKVYGEIPYGFRREGDLLVEAPAEKAVVGQIMAWSMEGVGLQETARRLNAKGIKTRRGRWSATQVRRVVRNDLNAPAAACK